MDAQKLQVKLYAQGALPGETVIPIFHAWIKSKRLPELLIDVANYAHVPDGPGVALIGHGGDFFVDGEKGRLGLLYSRKRGAPAADVRLADAFRRALHAAAILEAEPALGGKVTLGGGELLFRINDRLTSPSGDATFAVVKPELEALGKTLFGGAPFELLRTSGPKELFAVTLKCGASARASELLARLGGPPGPDVGH
jgi:hypothetical protein